jgi:hypothetical protein
MMLHPVPTHNRVPVPVKMTLLATLLLLLHCRKPYAPPAVMAANHFLVVDGIINTGVNAVTSIRLSRTRNLSDSIPGGIPELKAQVAVMAGNGASFPLQDTAGTGVYTSAVLTLDAAQTFKIALTTADGRKYASDLVVNKPTPGMDSLYYEEPGDFTVYVDTHDPTGNTRYYRWDYTETWEHDSQLMSGWIVVNNLVVPQDSTNQRTNCYTTVNSSNILLGTSEKLGTDQVRHFPIRVITNGDPIINQKYSILVRQYALTQDAYNYWSLIQKTSQGLGTLFDLQPAQLIGNIHCLTNPEEPVVGYMSASTIGQRRIFVYQSDLLNWIHNPPAYQCDTLMIPVDQTDYRIYTYPDSIFTAYYFVSTGGPLVLVSRTCVDCTLFGGSTVKPSYWK